MRAFWIVVIPFVVLGCGSSSDAPKQEGTSSGGSTSTGGTAGSSNSGGAPAAGGSSGFAGWSGSAGAGEVPGQKQLLKPSDFTYLGRFTPPVSGRSALWWGAKGISRWTVDGETRFLTIIDRSTLPLIENMWIREFRESDIVLEQYPNKPEVPWTREWRFSDVIDPNIGARRPSSFWVDPVTKDLYFPINLDGNGRSYNIQSNDYPILGRSAWNEVAQTWEYVGRWYFDDATSGKQFAQGGFTEIPEWFREQYGLGDRRIGVGMGCYTSMISYGTSIGPALAAIERPTTLTNGPMNSFTVLMSHLYNKQPWQFYGRRLTTDHAELSDVGMYDANDHGIGRWGAQDFAHEAGVWIDTPTKHGLLLIATMSTTGEAWHGGVANIVSYTGGGAPGTPTTITIDAVIPGLVAGDRIGHEPQQGQSQFTTTTGLSTDGLSISLNWPSGSAGSSFPKIGGRVVRGTVYAEAALHNSLSRHYGVIYDPTELGEIAQGTRQRWDVTPTSQFDWFFPGWPDPVQPRGSHTFEINGILFDPATRRLYVVERAYDSTPGGGTPGGARVIGVYRVAE
jgi:hypothetical protein